MSNHRQTWCTAVWEEAGLRTFSREDLLVSLDAVVFIAKSSKVLNLNRRHINDLAHLTVSKPVGLSVWC